MAVTLKKKITLKRKGEAADFTFSGKLKVKLFWSSPTDLDLCIFFKKKNGEVGGIFSNVTTRDVFPEMSLISYWPFCTLEVTSVPFTFTLAIR
jgi:hypothetical protein